MRISGRIGNKLFRGGKTLGVGKAATEEWTGRLSEEE